MRPPERIENFLKKINWFELLHNQWNLFNSKWDAHTYTKIIKKNIMTIQKFWKKNPDLRISQVLINLNVIPNIPGIWYYDEESKLLINQGYPPEECLFWTSIFNQNNELLDKPITRLIVDLKPTHIKNIITYMTKRKKILSQEYKQAFKNVLTKSKLSNYGKLLRISRRISNFMFNT